jgi:hypothetical protein
VICPDCAAAADWIWNDDVPVIDQLDVDVLGGHDRCVARNLGAVRGSEDCSCQHRPVRVVSGG